MSAYLDWRVGDKIVCIDSAPRLVDRFPRRAFNKPPLTVGETYTVRALQDDDEGNIGVLLHEVAANLGPLASGRERPFDPSRFHPVQKRTTDISILKAILLNPHIPVKEDA